MQHFILPVIFLMALPGLAAEGDTHPQLCSNIRSQLSESCSEESDTMDPATGALIKRTYEECYEQDFKVTLNDINEKFPEMFGIFFYDDSGESEELICATKD